MQFQQDSAAGNRLNPEVSVGYGKRNLAREGRERTLGTRLW